MMGSLARIRWLAGVVWASTWFELYLEIFRFRHVAIPTFLGGDSTPLAIGPHAHAGWWLRTDLWCAVVAPVVFATVALVLRRHRLRSDYSALHSGAAGFPALTIAVMGALVMVLGLLNQIVRHQPLALDLSLRHGNGGFVALGGLCSLIGFFAAFSLPAGDGR